MPILTEAEIPIYAPSVTLTGVVLEAQIAFTQGIMESYQGANRPLELTPFVEVVPVNQKLQTVWPSYCPISATPAMTVEVRVANALNCFHRASGADEWNLLEADDWNLNENNRIDLNFSNWGFRRSGTIVSQNNEARLSYTAGFDFTQASSDIIFIKTLAGQILTYQQSDTYQGIKRKKVDKQYEVEWQAAGSNSGFDIGKIPASFLTPLKKFSPKLFF